MTTPKPHIEAELAFVSTEEGGRRSPVRSGYRVPHDFYNEGVLADAIQTYPQQEEVQPGQTVVALLTLFYPEAHKGRLYPGLTFLAREGAKVVAKGRITRVLDEALARK